MRIYTPFPLTLSLSKGEGSIPLMVPFGFAHFVVTQWNQDRLTAHHKRAAKQSRLLHHFWPVL